MSNQEKLWEICKEIYRQQFKEAEPSASFDQLVKERGQDRFFEEHFLSMERQVEIIDEICKKHKIRKWEKRLISQEVHLGCSPNSCKDTTKKVKVV